MQAGLKHVVWSTLEDPRPFIDASIPDLKNEPGRKVTHFETKEEIQVTATLHWVCLSPPYSLFPRGGTVD